MRFDCPRGFEMYRTVLLLLGDIRSCGKWCKFRCLFQERHRNGDRNYSGLAWIGYRGQLIARCLGCGAGWLEFVKATETHTRDWYPPSELSRDKRKPMEKQVLKHTFQYIDAAGNLVYEKLRFEPGFDGAKKSLSFRRPLPPDLFKAAQVPLGETSWVYGITDDSYGRADISGKWNLYKFRPNEHTIQLNIAGVDPVLYRLPSLIKADPSQPVLIVEGEKDVDLLCRLGFVAVCGPHGSSNWLPQWSGYLKDRRVAVVPDYNLVGQQHADVVVGSVLRHGAKSVRVVQWDADGAWYPGPGGGIGNWFERFAIPDQANTIADRKKMVIGLCKRAVEYRC